MDQITELTKGRYFYFLVIHTYCNIEKCELLCFLPTFYIKYLLEIKNNGSGGV